MKSGAPFRPVILPAALVAVVILGITAKRLAAPPSTPQRIVRLAEWVTDPRARTELTWNAPRGNYRQHFLLHARLAQLNDWIYLEDPAARTAAAPPAAVDTPFLRFPTERGLLACVLPVEPERLVELQVSLRRFTRESESVDQRAGIAFVQPLTRVIDLASELERKSLAEIQQAWGVPFRHYGVGPIEPDDGWQTLSTAFRTPFETRALLITFMAGSGAASPPLDLKEITLVECSLRRFLGLGALPEAFPVADAQDGLAAQPTPLGLTPARPGDLRAPAWTIDHLLEQRQGFLLPPPARLTFEVDVPSEPTLLEWGVARFYEARETFAHRPITLRVSWQDLGSGEEHELWVQEVSDREPRGWQEAQVDLAKLSGTRVRLCFEADPDDDARAASSPDLLAIGSPLLRPVAPPDRRPNVLIVSLDTLRADHLGIGGYARPTSPRIDAFARESFWFRAASSTSSYTLPAHVSLLTGQLPSLHGVISQARDRNVLLPSRSEYLATRLAAEGYSTAAFTGGAYLRPRFGFAAGFDRYQYVDVLLSDHDPRWGLLPIRGAPEFNQKFHRQHSLDQVLSWLGHHRHAPFFLFLHSYLVHNYEPSEPYRSQFLRDPAADGRERLPWVRDRTLEGTIPPEDLEFFVDRYDATIREADAAVGRLLDYLSEQRLLERTIVLLTSDHGEEFLDHGGLAHGRTLYQEMLHVPFVLHWPGLHGPAVIDAPVSLVDVVPTLYAGLGLTGERPISGRSLLPWMAGGPPETRRSIVAELELPGFEWQVLRRGPEKLLRRTPEVAAGPCSWFDLETDPGELTPVPCSTGAGTTLAAELDALLGEASRQRRSLDTERPEGGALDEATRLMLQHLGYETVEEDPR